MTTFILTFGLLTFSGGSEGIVVLIPTVEQETEYVWRTIQDISFFDEYGYDISLPESELIESLKDKSREGMLTNEDYKLLSDFMRKEVYRKTDYEKGYKNVVKEIPLLEAFLNEIRNSKRNWHFRLFETYTVTLTLYGPGGSYNPEDGSILLYTTTEGNYKQYNNPANTIIHEITHIGLEESIIQQYNIPHELKERIVDIFVYLNFKDRLPTYRIQNMGDTRIDEQLNDKEDLQRLEEIVQNFLTQN